MKFERSALHYIIIAALVAAVSASGQTVLYAPNSGAVGAVTNSTGNVGVGTATPSARFEAHGSYGGTGSGGDIYGNAENSYIGVDASVSRMGLVKQWGNYPVVGADSATPIIFGNFSTTNLLGTITASTPFVERMRISADGKVGIGTVTPYSKLHVHNPASVGLLGDGIRVSRPSSDNCYAFVSYGGGASGEGGDTAFFGSVYAGGTKGRITFRVSDGANNLDAATIDPVGNVGIGTTNPTQKLSVNGTIRANEVIVDTGWSDYVFAKNYRLKTLSEVEAHIQNDGHLPDVPSAQEVADRGVSMGQMQAKLLAKIEELTLYAIAQEKRMTKLEGENADLRAVVKELSERR